MPLLGTARIAPSFLALLTIRGCIAQNYPPGESYATEACYIINPNPCQGTTNYITQGPGGKACVKDYSVQHLHARHPAGLCRQELRGSADWDCAGGLLGHRGASRREVRRHGKRFKYLLRRHRCCLHLRRSFAAAISLQWVVLLDFYRILGIWRCVPLHGAVGIVRQLHQGELPVLRVLDVLWNHVDAAGDLGVCHGALVMAVVGGDHP
jgi:hypothetical protein